MCFERFLASSTSWSCKRVLTGPCGGLVSTWKAWGAGTSAVHWSSPQLFRCSTGAGPSAESSGNGMFSFGCILYELLLGRRLIQPAENASAKECAELVRSALAESAALVKICAQTPESCPAVLISCRCPKDQSRYLYGLVALRCYSYTWSIRGMSQDLQALAFEHRTCWQNVPEVSPSKLLNPKP